MAKLVKGHEAAYIAGLFDGEGSVNAYYSKRGRFYVLGNITISQKRKEVLYVLQKYLGYGKVYTKYRRINITKIEDKIHFLELILPYLIVKREEAILGLELAKLLGKPGEVITPEKRARREEIYHELKALKDY